MNGLLVLNNIMDHKIDYPMLYVGPARGVAINLSHIVSIKHEYTRRDYTNRSYYIITLITGEKMFVNKMNATIFYSFAPIYTENEDYAIVDNLIHTSK